MDKGGNPEAKTMRHIILPALALAMCAISSGSDRIVTEGIVNAPVAEVWKAWTTSDGLASWLAPHADIDLRIGGLLRTNYSADGSLGDAGTIENEVMAFDPERMLAIRVSKAPSNFPFKDSIKGMWTVLYFTAESDGTTRLKIVGLGFTAEAESQKMKQFFERGNAFTVDQLRKRFETKPRD
jgi:uncharacterized protein YndB with AHSA1/START domain